jgi:hypothetical protein
MLPNRPICLYNVMNVCVLRYIYIAYLFIHLYVCVIFIVFPLQDWLYERTQLLSYMYIACLFIFQENQIITHRKFQTLWDGTTRLFLLSFTDVSKHSDVFSFKINQSRNP